MALSSGCRRISGALRLGICSMTSLLGSSRPMSTTNKVFVGGIPPWIKEPVLREAFSGFGDVSEAIIVRNTDTGESKGFGFVSFYESDSADAAMDGMDGQIVNNRTLRVRPASARTRP